MPYIKPERRQALREYDYTPLPKTAGELNYVYTRLLDRVLGNKPSYEDINTVVGVLECCLQEVYRRVATPLEIEKCETNGDVYRDRST